MTAAHKEAGQSVCFQGVSQVSSCQSKPADICHMDAVIMCSDGDPDASNILESDSYIFLSK